MQMYGHHQAVLVSVICLHKTHCLYEFISTHVTYPYNAYIYKSIEIHFYTWKHIWRPIQKNNNDK